MSSVSSIGVCGWEGEFNDESRRVCSDQHADGLVTLVTNCCCVRSSALSYANNFKFPDLTIKKARQNFHTPSLRLSLIRLGFISRNVFRRWGKTLASGCCESLPGTSLIVRLSSSPERKRTQMGTILFYLVSALAVRFLDFCIS